MTFGHLLVHGSPGLKKRAIQACAAAVWPVYWLVINGISGTLGEASKACVAIIHHVAALFRAIGVLNQAIIQALVPLLEPIGWAWAIGVVVFPVYYVATHWNVCESYGCLAMLGRACLWAPFWLVYWAMYFFE